MTAITAPIRRSWLVQRLKKPHHFVVKGKSVDNPFSFGGGLHNGGLSAEAMDLLRNVFSFDYMGAAEYEWGAVPEALTKIAGHASAGSLTHGRLTIRIKDVPPHWQDKTEVHPLVVGYVYLLAPADWMDEVAARVIDWATVFAYKSKYCVRDIVNLPSVLRPRSDDDYCPSTCGWLELDNGFMFFTDYQMWHDTAALFDVAVPAYEAPPEPPESEVCQWQSDSGVLCSKPVKGCALTPSALKAKRLGLCGTHLNSAVRRGWQRETV